MVGSDVGIWYWTDGRTLSDCWQFHVTEQLQRRISNRTGRRHVCRRSSLEFGEKNVIDGEPFIVVRWSLSIRYDGRHQIQMMAYRVGFEWQTWLFDCIFGELSWFVRLILQIPKILRCISADVWRFGTVEQLYKRCEITLIARLNYE